MTPHLHREYVEGCYRCDLSRDEMACGSKMCSAPHKTIFGRCYCAKPKGHQGLHDCRREVGANG